LFVDGIYRARSTVAPYTVSVDTVGLGDGMHVFELRLFDNAGRSNTSHKTSYWVTGSGPAVAPSAPRNDSTNPTVDLFTPDKNGHVSGWYQITSAATDNFGVSKVEYFASGTLVCTDSSAPFDGCLWNSWKVPNGNFLVSAKAYDFSGNVAVDDFSGDVMVENTGNATQEPAPPPPPLPPPAANPAD
jgi:Bacterial Ig domain